MPTATMETSSRLSYIEEDPAKERGYELLLREHTDEWEKAFRALLLLLLRPLRRYALLEKPLFVCPSVCLSVAKPSCPSLSLSLSLLYRGVLSL